MNKNFLYVLMITLLPLSYNTYAMQNKEVEALENDIKELNNEELKKKYFNVNLSPYQISNLDHNIWHFFRSSSKDSNKEKCKDEGTKLITAVKQELENKQETDISRAQRSLILGGILGGAYFLTNDTWSRMCGWGAVTAGVFGSFFFAKAYMNPKNICNGATYREVYLIIMRAQTTKRNNSK